MTTKLTKHKVLNRILALALAVIMAIPSVSVGHVEAAGETTITVGKTGCDYTTINDALDAVAAMSRPNNERVIISIQPGNYEETLIVNVPNVTLKNASATPSIELKNGGVDIDDNAVRITYYYGHGYSYYSMDSDYSANETLYETNKAKGSVSTTNPGAGSATQWNATVRIQADGFQAEGIIFENSFNQYVSEKAANDIAKKESGAKEGSTPRMNLPAGSTAVQDKAYVERAAALAIANKVQQAYFENCKFVGHQDTLYGGESTAAFYDCDIMGGTDYIFGKMTAVFAKCDLMFLTSDHKDDKGYITAAQTPSGKHGMLMYNCRITSAVPGKDNVSTYTSKPGYFGRPWAAGTGEAVFFHTIIDAADSNWSSTGKSLIVGVGWLDTLKGQSALCGEYNTYEMCGVDYSSSRATWAAQFTEPKLADGSSISVATFLGSWNPFAGKDMTIVLPDGTETTEPTSASSEASSESGSTGGGSTVPTGGAVHDFTANGTTSSFYTITGNLSTGKGTCTYNGLSLTQCLKMESSTRITFNAASAGTLVLVFGGSTAASGKKVIVDGTAYTADSNGIVSASLAAGSHTITKGDSINLFYMTYVSEEGSTEASTEATEEATEATIAPTEATEAPTEAPTEATEESSEPTVVAGDIFVSPSGKSSAAGTQADPMDFVTALSSIQAGNTIWMLDGTYNYTSTILIQESNSGKSGAYKSVRSVNANKAIIDFTGMAEASSNRGIVLDGAYWHFYGVDICNAGDNGMLLSGDHNIIELCQFYNNHDSGLQLSRYNTAYASLSQWPSNNLIKNCTSYDNKDNATTENADGFAAKLTCGEGNVFDGCIAYCNCDDGWDLYAKPDTGSIGVVTIKNCVAFGNGKTTDGTGSSAGDMNGFKLGGSNGACPTAHVVINSLAFNNGATGFTDNGNGGAVTLTNCTSANNGVYAAKANYVCYRTSSSAKYTNLLSFMASSSGETDYFLGKLDNVLYHYKSSGYYWVDSYQATGAKEKYSGSEAKDKTVSASDFVTTTVPGYTASGSKYATNYHEVFRNADGSINLNGLYELKDSSALRTAANDGGVLGSTFSSTTGDPVVPSEPSSEETSEPSSESSEQVIPAGGMVHNFTTNGTTSSFYTITGNLSTGKGSTTYNGLNLTQCLKMESSTSISFTAGAAGKLVLVFGGTTSAAGSTVKVDGTSYTVGADNTVTIDLNAGAHTITKGGAINLFYMAYVSEESSTEASTEATEETTEATTEASSEATEESSEPSSEVINGLEEASDGNYYYYTDGVVDTSKEGIIYYEKWGKFVYLEEGRWATDKVTYAEYGGGKFLVDGGEIATSVNGLHQDPANTDTWYFLSAGQVQSNVTNVVIYDGAAFYIENGIKANDYNGFVDYNGGTFLVAGGQLQLNVTTLTCNDADGKWYYIANGQVQKDVTDLVLYNGAWFYVVNGVWANDYVGIVDYSGGKFYVANGQVATSVNGLQFNTEDGKWYFIGGGQVQTGYTGPVEYNGATFNVVNGIVQ